MSDLITRESGVLVPAGADRQLRERIAELELAAEDSEWILLGNADQSFEFSRSYLTTITRLARLTYIKNPLVQRGVRVKADYVYGRQVNIQAKEDDVNAVIQAFLDDPHNQSELTAQAARIQKEIELQTDGNIFFVLVPHIKTGHIRVRTLDVDEITDIICNPDDRKEQWYYKREYTENAFNFATGRYDLQKRTLYYRDWRYKPPVDRSSIGSDRVVENQFIYHVKVGGFSNWKFGLSEIYASIDWSKAYKTFLENWSTIVAAYARFAFKVTTTGGKTGVAAAKSRLETTIGTASSENNPKPTTASTFVQQTGTNIDPIRTAGATTSADDGRRLLLMVCAAFGLPETFFGDVSVGTLATAKSLDRPTELMITNRQTLWADIYHDLIEFVLYYAVAAIDGPLRAFGDVAYNEYGEVIVNFDETLNTHVDVDFPSVIERDMQAMVSSIISAATLDGKTPTLLNDSRLLARMLLTQLGENDIDEIIDAIYDENGQPINVPETPAPKPVASGQPAQPAQLQGDLALAQAGQQLAQSIEALREALYPSTRKVDLTPLAPIVHAEIDRDAFFKD